MKSKTKLSTLPQVKSRFRLLLLILLLAFSQSIFAQHYFQVKDVSADKVIQLLENQLDIKFNFTHNNLPQGYFSFSCSGSKEQVLTTTFSILNRKFVKLDQSVFAIQKNIFPKEKKVEPIFISGTLIDLFGNPLPAATVWLPELGEAFETNFNGQFEIKGFFANEEKVEFRYLGYQSQIKTIGQLSKKKNPKVVLQEQQHMLSEIVVTDQSSSLVELEVLEDVILPNQMMPMPGKADKDVLSIVKMLPGMYTADESVSQIQTRGGPPDQTNLEWNGIQLYQTSHFYGKISAVNPFAVDRISIVRNGGSAKNSGQASGTISMRDTDGTNDSLRVKLHSNLLYSNVGVNLPLWKNRAQLRLSWRKSYSQFFENVIFNRFFDNSFQFGRVQNEQYYREFWNLDSLVSLTPRMSFQDIFASLKINLSKKDFIKVSSTFIESNFQYLKTGEVLDVSPKDDIEYKNTGWGLGYFRNWNQHITTQLHWSSSTFNNTHQYLEDPDNYEVSNEQLQENILLQNTFQINQSFEKQDWKISTGFKYEHLDYDLYELGRSGNLVDVYYDDEVAAAEKSLYLQGLWRRSAKWQIEAGIRYSDYELAENKYLEPRIHASFFPSKGWTIHGHWGRYHQVLNKKHLFNTFNVDNGFWYLSNESEVGNYVHVVENAQKSIGAKYQRKGWELGLDLYDKNSNDLWSSAFDFDTDNDPYVFTDLKVQGLELSVKYNRDWFSLFWTYDRVKEELTLEDGTITKSPFSQPHRLSFFQAAQWKRWQMALHWKFSSGRYFSEPIGIDTYIDQAGDERPYVAYEELFTQQLPNYHTLDLSLFYKFSLSTSKLKGHVGCSLTNVYNRSNIIKYEYHLDWRFDEVQVSLHPWVGLPFTPNLVFELEF